MTSERTAWGHGLATVHEDGSVLDAWYPQPALGIPIVKNVVVPRWP